MGFCDGSGIIWIICKQSASRFRHITTATPHHSTFTRRMLFRMPNQQCQSTEGNKHRRSVMKCREYLPWAEVINYVATEMQLFLSPYCSQSMFWFMIVRHCDILLTVIWVLLFHQNCVHFGAVQRIWFRDICRCWECHERTREWTTSARL